MASAGAHICIQVCSLFPCTPPRAPCTLVSVSGRSVMTMKEVYEAVGIIGLEMFAHLRYGQS